MSKKNRGQQQQPKKQFQQPAQMPVPEKGTPAGGPTDDQVKDYQDAEAKVFFEEMGGIDPEVFNSDKLKNITGDKNYGPIDKKRWAEAQVVERGYHNLGFAEGLMHYNQSYKNYFNYVGLGTDLGGMTVIEIGPADFPALYFCDNFNGVIIEPMKSEHLQRICESKNIQLIQKTLEELEDGEIMATQVSNALTEVWLFNVMQHIVDPDTFVNKVKAIADRIRFFEPIDQPVEVHHPQSYNLQDFKAWFGECVQLYEGGNVPGFHTAPCAYGVWIK